MSRTGPVTLYVSLDQWDEINELKFGLKKVTELTSLL